MLTLVVALLAEAKPLISRFKLKKRIDSHAFPVYTSDTCQLVISGVGKCQSAAATAWIANASDHHDNVWLNVGIAGHAVQVPGTLICANRITDNATQRSWYPVQLASPFASEKLITFDHPINRYIDNTLHDMEASGFIQTALRFSTAELVQCVKVVSDNADNPMENLSESLVDQLISANCEALVHYSDYLLELAREEQPVNITATLQQFKELWKFTCAQQQQLERLLQRRQIVLGTFIELPDPLRAIKSTSGVLAWLHAELQNTPLNLSS